MNFVKLAFLFITGVFISSCGSLTVYDLQKIPVEEVQNYPLIYTLPQTVVRVEVEVANTRLSAGPYANYAYKYLGLPDVIHSDSSYWSVSGINISDYSLPDPQQQYAVEASGACIGNLIQLNSNGVLLGFNQDELEKEKRHNTDLFYGKVIEESQHDSDIPVINSLTERSDTLYQTVYRDSNYIRVPIIKKYPDLKTAEEKAKEIADQILELKEEKVSLLIGDVDEYPDGDALKLILDEMNQIEEKYLPLFVGSTHIRKKKYVFEIIPEKEMLKEGNVLFSFSPSLGILPVGNPAGTPVHIRFDGLGNSEQIPALMNRLDTLVDLENKGLVYRVPQWVSISVFEGTKLLMGKRMEIPQLGNVAILPSKLLLRKKGALQFDPKSGNLKAVLP